MKVQTRLLFGWPELSLCVIAFLLFVIILVGSIFHHQNQMDSLRKKQHDQTRQELRVLLPGVDVPNTPRQEDPTPVKSHVLDEGDAAYYYCPHCKAKLKPYKDPVTRAELLICPRHLDVKRRRTDRFLDLGAQRIRSH